MEKGVEGGRGRGDRERGEGRGEKGEIPFINLYNLSHSEKSILRQPQFCALRTTQFLDLLLRRRNGCINLSMFS